MAENEEIDLSKARRWQSVVQALKRGESVDPVADKVRDCLYKTLRSLRKKIPLEELIRAIDIGAPALDRLARKCDAGREFAELLAQVAAEGGTRETVLEDFVTDICNAFFDQILHQIVPSSGWPDVSGLRAFLDQVLAHLRADVERIARKFAENPGWNPRQARRSQGALSPDTTSEMLQESLLERSRK